MKPEEIKETELQEGTSIEVGRVSFSFTLTRDEAEAIVNKPKSAIARKMRRYMTKILETAAKKFVESKKEDNVTNCKLNVD